MYGAKSSSLYRVAATNAVPASCGDASMIEISAHSGRSFGVTSVQCAPPSRVTCTSPSSEPAHSTFESFGDGANAKIVA